MIRFILLQNRQGKSRLSKWYVPFNAAEKNKIEQEIHRAVSTIEKASKKALVRLKCIVLAVSANAR